MLKSNRFYSILKVKVKFQQLIFIDKTLYIYLLFSNFFDSPKAGYFAAG
jgi:hypothetical protein